MMDIAISIIVWYTDNHSVICIAIMDNNSDSQDSIMSIATFTFDGYSPFHWIAGNVSIGLYVCIVVL